MNPFVMHQLGVISDDQLTQISMLLALGAAVLGGTCLLFLVCLWTWDRLKRLLDI